LRESEKRLLRNTFGPKNEDVTGRRGKLHNELHDIYSSAYRYSMRTIKSRRKRWMEHVARTRKKRKWVRCRKLKERVRLEELGAYGY
jgi:hypothetical protein